MHGENTGLVFVISIYMNKHKQIEYSSKYMYIHTIIYRKTGNIDTLIQ